MTAILELRQGASHILNHLQREISSWWSCLLYSSGNAVMKRVVCGQLITCHNNQPRWKGHGILCIVVRHIWEYTCLCQCGDPFYHISLRWRHHRRDSVSSHQPHDCLLNRLFRRRSKKTSKLRVTGLLRGIHRGPVNSPQKWPVTRQNVSIWWRHHVHSFTSA